MFFFRFVFYFILVAQSLQAKTIYNNIDFSQYDTSKYSPVVVQVVFKNLSFNKSFRDLNPEAKKTIIYAFLSYLSHLKLDTSKATHIQQLEKTIDRLLNSSTQFLICNPEDWVCLEKKPLLTPSTIWRQDVANDLGKPIWAGHNFNVEAYFTTAWADVAFAVNNIKATNEIDRKKQRDFIINKVENDMRENRITVEKILANKIKENADQGLWMSLYGIDDIHHSMKNVYQAIISRKNENKLTKAVVDVADEGASNQFLRQYDVLVSQTVSGTNTFSIVPLADQTISFSYLPPADESYWFFGAAKWQKEVFELGQIYRANGKTLKNLHDELFTQSQQSKETEDLIWLMGLNKSTQGDVLKAVRSGYQYDSTIDLIKYMNEGAVSNEEAPFHIEWPAKGIMHNKFMIMQNSQNEKFVWTGTANIARTCMGNENNSNMSLFIKNNIIADSFLTEFNEMYLPIKQKEKDLATGAFHNKKRPNTKRYFKFTDGHEVRLHFSPTDDGEHRAIIPMLRSAKVGDIIRISMFGGSGLEYVRAIQHAVAKGAHVKIVMDNLTSSGNTMWAKSEIANLLDANPYVQKPMGSVEVRFSNWLDQNHHKTATLQRKKGRTEYLIVGSQNWSEGGNDMNDENMMTIRNKFNSIRVADQFNKEFDEKMWILSDPVKRESKNEKSLVGTPSNSSNSEFKR